MTPSIHTHKHHTHTQNHLINFFYERCATLWPASVPNWTTAGYTMFTHSCLFMKPRGVARNHVTGAESNTCPKDSHQLILKGPDLLQCVQRSVVGFLHLCIHAAPKPLLVLCKCFFHVCTHTHRAHWASGVSHTHTAHWASGVSHTHSTLGQWCQSHTHSALGQWCQSHTQAHWASGVSHTHTQHTGPVVSVTHPVFWASSVSHTHSTLGQWCQSHTHTHSTLGQWSHSTHSQCTWSVVSVTHTQCTGPVVSITHPQHTGPVVSDTHSALGQWCQSHMSVTSILFWGSLLVSVTHTHTHTCMHTSTHTDLSRLYSNSLQSAGPSGPTSQCEFRLHRTYLTMWVQVRQATS